MLRLSLISILYLAFVMSIARAEDPIAEALKQLHGEWQEVERDTQGKKTTKADAGFNGLRFVIVGDQLTVGNRKKTIKIDPGKSPKEIDMISHNGLESGQTVAGIYKLEKDRWTICQPYWTADTTKRPKEFKAGADDGIMLLVLERVNPK